MQSGNISSVKDPSTGNTLSSIPKNSIYDISDSFPAGLTMDTEESKQSFDDDMSRCINYDWKDWLSEIEKTKNLKSELLTNYKEKFLTQISKVKDMVIERINKHASDRIISLNEYFSQKQAEIDAKKAAEQKKIDNWINFIQEKLSEDENKSFLNHLNISDEASKEKSNLRTWCQKTRKERNDLRREIQEYWEDSKIFDSDNLDDLKHFLKLYETVSLKISDEEFQAVLVKWESGK